MVCVRQSGFMLLMGFKLADPYQPFIPANFSCVTAVKIYVAPVARLEQQPWALIGCASVRRQSLRTHLHQKFQHVFTGRDGFIWTNALTTRKQGALFGGRRAERTQASRNSGMKGSVPVPPAPTWMLTMTLARTLTANSQASSIARKDSQFQRILSQGKTQTMEATTIVALRRKMRQDPRSLTKQHHTRRVIPNVHM